MRSLGFRTLVCLLVGCSRSSLDGAPDAQIACAPLEAGHIDASAPHVDASSDVHVVDAAGAELCLVGGNVFHVEGDLGDPVYPDTATIKSADGTWSGMMAGGLDVQVVVSTASVTSWAFVFRDLDHAIEAKEYDDVTTVPTNTGARFMALYMDGRTCYQGTARVTFVTLDGSDQHLSLTATFEVHCKGLTPAVRGCVHYEPN